jgi:two-component system, LytTR family, sensor kinase
MSPMVPVETVRPRWVTVVWWTVLYLESGLLAYNIWVVEPVVSTGESFRATWLYRYGDPWLGWLLLPLVLIWRRHLPVETQRWGWLAAGHLAGAALMVAAGTGFRAALMLLSNGLPPGFFPGVWSDVFEWSAAAGFAGLYFAMIVPIYALDFYQGWRNGQREAEELKLANARMETRLVRANLDALKMQLHPHFLFNALNSVNALIRRGRVEEAEEAVARLGTLLRRALNHRQELLVPLEEELAFLEDYFAVERIRFRDRLEVRIEVAADCRRALSPSLLLQPLVENAMKHGFSRLPEARLLDLRAWREGDRLVLELYNDGPGLDLPVAATGTGIGLHNTRTRLAMMYGPRASLTLKDSPPRGVCARIELPFTISAHEKDQDPHR